MSFATGYDAFVNLTAASFYDIVPSRQAPHTANPERQRVTASRGRRGLSECSGSTSLQTVKRVVHALLKNSSEPIPRQSHVNTHFCISGLTCLFW